MTTAERPTDVRTTAESKAGARRLPRGIPFFAIIDTKSFGALVLTVCGAALATMKPDRNAAAEVHGGRSHDGSVAETATTRLERTRRG